MAARSCGLRVSALPHDDDSCVSDGEKLQIEGWIGQKWGFYQSPLDPDRCAPVPADELGWREIPAREVVIDGDNIQTWVLSDRLTGLGVDLSMPLKPPLGDAYNKLAILQR